MDDYKYSFQFGKRNNLRQAKHYLAGLFLTERGKRNIERMSEQTKQNYQSQHHFISESSWSAHGLMRTIGINANKLLGDPAQQCLSIDESSNAKAGKHSVGVSRQHNGNLGKVDNCQTGVYASLCSGNTVGIINARLFLPKEWIDDSQRCKKAGIPKEVVFKTKPELALDMIKETKAAGIEFGWINADGLYGQSYEFCKSIEDMGLNFVVDVHKNQPLYINEPLPALPVSKVMGRPLKRLKCDDKAVTAEQYCALLSDKDFELVKIRPGTKGWIMGLIHKAEVWVWNGKDAKARKRTLLIRKNISDSDIKYCLSNIGAEKETHQRFAFMQAQRHWIERAFEDGKGELGMADMQVRKYTAWYHHQALVMLAMQYVNEQKIARKKDIPLLSLRDVRLQTIAFLKNDGVLLETEIEQMLKRHLQRQKDIRRYYKTETS